jgi:hypothetical protein
MTGVLLCAAVSLAIFALVALADERWPDRLSRRGLHLRGEKWRGEWGANPSYSGSASAYRTKRGAASLSDQSLIGH